MKKDRKHFPLILGLSFAVVAYAMLLIFEKDLLFRTQELNLFLPTKMWFSHRMDYPAGFLSVIASFLNQFTFYP